MSSLKAAFPILKEGNSVGTITAASSSKLADGAAALILASGKFCTTNNILPIARIVAYAESTQESALFGISPALAIKKLISKQNKYTLGDIDLFEINEAFAVVTLANIKILGIPTEKCNILGGSVAIGHPLGR